MSRPRRFVVLTVTGYRIHPGYVRTGRHGVPPGVSATVYDSTYDRAIATYRSEEQGHTPPARRHRKAIRQATEHADRLEAELG